MSSPGNVHGPWPGSPTSPTPPVASDTTVRCHVSWINADVAINVVREPTGEWLSLDGRSWLGRTGSGQVQATISDTEGIVSTVSMVRLVDPPGCAP